MTWIQTYTGKQFYPLEPRLDDICIEDIAHALSMICRFNGHTKNFYSVAEHSVYVSQFCPDNLKLKGLLHDASEAYISDVGKPIKPELQGYSWIENQLQGAIEIKFNVCQDPHRFVKEIDRRILADEQMQVMGPHPVEWSQTRNIEPLGVKINCWSPNKAEYEFMKLFYELTNTQLTMDDYEL